MDVPSLVNESMMGRAFMVPANTRVTLCSGENLTGTCDTLQDGDVDIDGFMNPDGENFLGSMVC